MSHLYTKFISELSQIYDAKEAKNISNLAFEEIMGLSKIKPDKLPIEISTENTNKLENILAELLTHKPIQYVLGFAYFYGLKLMVNKNVLIPRQETEELVHQILNDYKTKKNHSLKILDIGTGSGCIALALKANLSHAEIWALDNSYEALEVAKQNSLINKLPINFINQDILKGSHLKLGHEAFDIIVSNPPYILPSEAKEMKKNVLNFEPYEALFTPENDPLKFYKSIINLSNSYLKKEGFLYFEINENKSNALLNTLKISELNNFYLIKDLNERARIVKATFS